MLYQVNGIAFPIETMKDARSNIYKITRDTKHRQTSQWFVVRKQDFLCFFAAKTLMLAYTWESRISPG